MNAGFDNKKYLKRISERIEMAMKSQGVTQVNLAERLASKGYSISQSTISKILADATNMTIPNIIPIATVLGVDLNELLSVNDSRVVTIQGQNDPIVSEFIRRTDNRKMRPYLNTYYTYFFPTPSSENGILRGKLSFVAAEDNSRCVAKFEFETGSLDSQKKPCVKRYQGEMIISESMRVAYCTLINEEIGEISYLMFSYIPILFQTLECRIALVLTASAGANRMPTVQRMIISQNPLTDYSLEILKGQLYLNESEILISEDGLARFMADERLDYSFVDYARKNTNDGFLGVRSAPYYYFNESIIRNAPLCKEVKNEAISLIRQYSSSPKYNKVGAKCDELVFQLINGWKTNSEE